MNKKQIKIIKHTITFSVTFLFTTLLFISPVHAQSDPSAEISAIIGRVVRIATQVGSGVLLLFIVKDAFEILQNKDNPMFRGLLVRDIFLFVISAVFLFKPDFILNAIKFIANV